MRLLSRLWIILTFLAMGTLLGSWMARDQSPRLQVPGNPPFETCFRPPVLFPPSKVIRDRVKNLGALLERKPSSNGPELNREIDPAWILALITHESGGLSDAISPTGCAGMVAICAPPEGASNCCRPDPEDQALNIYDLCNIEKLRGYACQKETDYRFDPAASLDYTVRRLNRLVEKAHIDRLNLSTSVEFALPLSWNVGLGVFSRYPKSMDSVEGALGQLNYRMSVSYRGWKPSALINKSIEAYDYLAWTRYLHRFWRKSSQELEFAMKAGSEYQADWVCLTYNESDPGGNFHRISSRSDQEQAKKGHEYTNAHVMRLSLGKYERDQVWIKR